MARPDRSSLLQFLSKPRYMHEVAEQFSISPKLAKHQLLKEAKFGRILVSTEQTPYRFLDSKGTLKRMEEFLYVSRNSPLLAEGPLKLTTGNRKVETFALRTRADTVFVKFLPKKQTPTENPRRAHAVSQSRKASALHGAGKTRSEKRSRSNFLNLVETKAKMAKRKIYAQRTEDRTTSNPDKHKSLSHMEKIHLFQALSDQPLPFLDLHGRFGVSKQTVRRFIKRGYLEEVWGPRDIGVKFMLTRKGKKHLKELEAAARFELQQRNNIVIRLKDRISS